MRKKPTYSRRGSALVITLAILVLVTILAVGMVSMVRLERISARNVLETMQAKALSDAAAEHAMALVRDAIAAAENTTTNTTAGSQKFWASQPGKITVFNSDGTIDAASSRLLYSTNSETAPPLVDLNAALFDGSHPIITDDGSGMAPVMPVPWVTLRKNASQPASAANPIVGRYAFWVDDESTKLNLNTADGSTKAGTNSFGPGTPAEMNLQTLTNASAPLTTVEAANIATRSGAQYSAAVTSRPLNSAREILQVPGISTNLFSAHFQDLTTYNRAPELNIFGEPKIHLTPVTQRDTPSRGSGNPVNNTPLSLICGPYADVNLSPSALISPATLDAINQTAARDTGGYPRVQNRLSWIYPSTGRQAAQISDLNSQLPLFYYSYIKNDGSTVNVTTRLPQFFHDEQTAYLSGATGTPPDGYLLNARDYDMGMRIARYLKGKNSQGNPLKWPPFPGSGNDGFSQKYTDRQIDEITLQILSQLKQLYPDHYYGHTIPYYIRRGFLSQKPVRGHSRSPRLTELILHVKTIAGDPPQMKLSMRTEYYLPKGFAGCDLSFQNYGNWKLEANSMDIPSSTSSPSLLGGFWADNMLKVVDQNGNSAGFDFMGARGDQPDPDQARAALYHHPWALKDPAAPYNPTTNPYLGSGIAPPGNPTAFFPLWNFVGLPESWSVGGYASAGNRNVSISRPMKSGTTSVKLTGGISLWLKDSSGRFIESIPLDAAYETDSAILLNAVIPIPDGPAIPIPGEAVYHLQVKDPLVNNFPADWQGEVLPDLTDAKITLPATASTYGVVYSEGQNTISKPSAGADPQSAWWPQQNLGIPKNQRFPSSGYLQFLHTGIMPDKEFESKPLREQKGTPFRLLNFSPSTAASQKTLGGNSYPDWALLDLFTTPAIFQALGDPLPNPIIRTWGGATAGRINPNAVLEPFGLTRIKPLEALFKDVPVSTSYDPTENPVSTITDAAALAKAVTSYVSGLGRPLMLPGEICNVPEVAAFVYQGVDAAARSRNDLVRQTVGNLSTRSNTFTVWAIGEVLKKKVGNTNYGTFESGDLVLGRSRMRYVIERYLDPGTDGVYGNAVDPGPDGTVNTPDDPITAATGAHPAMTYPLPYKYRIISTSQVD